MITHLGQRATLRTFCGEPVERRWWYEWPPRSMAVCSEGVTIMNSIRINVPHTTPSELSNCRHCVENAGKMLCPPTRSAALSALTDFEQGALFTLELLKKQVETRTDALRQLTNDTTTRAAAAGVAINSVQNVIDTVYQTLAIELNRELNARKRDARDFPAALAAGTKTNALVSALEAARDEMSQHCEKETRLEGGTQECEHDIGYCLRFDSLTTVIAALKGAGSPDVAPKKAVPSDAGRARVPRPADSHKGGRSKK